MLSAKLVLLRKKEEPPSILDFIAQYARGGFTGEMEVFQSVKMGASDVHKML